ncbi:MAG: hypothetical protein C0460_07445 [Methylibium sp.]|jgi:hypothetical protein|nr:hypothetical protein [Methylibium sp.]MBY0366352.1 hypothetical protein [Burkholderiaceae bacterium]
MTSLTDSMPAPRVSGWRLLALALLIAVAPVAKAQQAERDPPTVAARVVSVVGDAWLFDHDRREWARMTRNQTVGEGDRVRTDERSRVSLRVGSTSIWVDERSDLELSQLDESQALLQVDRGDVAVRLRNIDNAMQTRLRTREGTAQPEREGLYRVEQLDRGSKVYVWQGRLRFTWARGAEPVWAGTGEQVEFWWPDGPRAERGPLYSDGFGDWVLAESRDSVDRPVVRYVSPEMTGAEDLDRYGRWETAPDYGAVWIPTTVVVADWAPYRYGHWAWSRIWGWTWVDDAPWGFAPFHYGRWVSWGGRWCWAPGAYVYRPVYAPALVGWVSQPAVSVQITIGSPPPPVFGWYPLAPREIYVPAYSHSPAYVGRINDPRDLRDPVTVQRPHLYRDAPTAVSLLPAPGAAIQPLPLRGPDRKTDPGPVRPLPTAPGRSELAAVLPPAPTRSVDVERPRDRVDRDAGLGWRSDTQLPVRREPNRDAPPSAATLPQRVMPAPMPSQSPQATLPQLPSRPTQAPPTQAAQAPLPQQPQVPMAPVPQAQLPQAQVQRPAVEPQRGGDTMPWRIQQQREDQQRGEEMQRRREEALQRQREQQRQEEMQQQRREEIQRREEMQQQQMRREEAQRREEMSRRVPQMEPQRMPEPPRMQAPAVPQPSLPQAQPRAPQPRDEGPQRGRPEGRHDDRPRDRQNER